MMTTAPAPPLDVLAEAMSGRPCTMTGLGATRASVPVGRWCGEVDHSDRQVLAHCTSATIDLGCGPGRMAAQLAREGVAVLGVDLAPAAVTRARARGVETLEGDVFDPLPDEGRWACALLADGNIGIGGDPARLLRRVRDLLVPGGRVVVDLAAPGLGLVVGSVRLTVDERTSHRFPWAVLGADAIDDVAEEADLRVRGLHEYAGRWCAVLVQQEVPPPCLS